MFRSDEQCVQASRVLLRRIRRDLPDKCWSKDNRPTAFLCKLADGHLGELSECERAFCIITLTLWNGAKGIDFGIVNRLDNGNLFALASLLQAIALGADFVDRWMVEQKAIQAGESDLERAYRDRTGDPEVYVGQVRERLS